MGTVTKIRRILTLPSCNITELSVAQYSAKLKRVREHKTIHNYA
jgi:metal-sulfur cluster biosynthetic enzyme